MNTTEVNKLFETELALMESCIGVVRTHSVMYPVYVPSKGRADKRITTKFLEDAKISFYVVVEPQDAAKYLENYLPEQVLVMKENDQGIAYARNFCKEHSQFNGDKYHWQIDDNIHNLGYRSNGKNRKASAEYIMGTAEAFLNRFTNVGGASLSHTMFAFAKKNSLDINKQVYSCALFCNNVPCSWKHDVIEDTDYSLQLLSKGYVTFLFNRLIMNKMATGVLKGGNTEISHGGNRRLLRSQKLAEYWPGWFKITEQYGRVKVAPSRIWKTFTQDPILKGELAKPNTDITEFYG
jgi:hypothetical protein